MKRRRAERQKTKRQSGREAEEQREMVGEGGREKRGKEKEEGCRGAEVQKGREG